MTTYEVPHPMELTDQERKLLDKINEGMSERKFTGIDNWAPYANAMKQLWGSIKDRIPKVRLRMFTDPEFAEVGGKSRMQVYESNGTSGEDIITHPHFVEWIRYFVNGPELPDNCLNGLCQILNEDRGTDGMVRDQCSKFIRKCIRERRLDKQEAGSEFFRFALEIGLDVHRAKSFRKTAMSVRT